MTDKEELTKSRGILLEAIEIGDKSFLTFQDLINLERYINSLEVEVCNLEQTQENEYRRAKDGM